MASVKKKAASAVAAVAVAAAVALGGTFAWQSISQTALNEASDVVNPGGRLHDDFYIDGNGDYNADVYVENFAEDEIFARVKLEEYLEVVVNYGTDMATPLTLVGSQNEEYGETALNVARDKDGNALYERVYAPYSFDGREVADEAGVGTGAFEAAFDVDGASWVSWTAGGAGSEPVWYMPTFNKNKDSLVADRNGMYVDRVGGISDRGQDQYEDWEVWADGDEELGVEIYDADANSVDEVKYDFENLDTYISAGNIKTVSDAAHAAAPVGFTNGLISMSEWLGKLNAGEVTADYWVYDTDGWVYWSSPIAGGETTGLLLDSIELNQVMDDTWYYAINVEAQFITADDLGDGSEGNPGFLADGLTPEALALLGAIGVEVLDAEEGQEALAITAMVGDRNIWSEDDQVGYAEQGDIVTLTVTGSGAETSAVEWSVSPDDGSLEFEKTEDAGSLSLRLLSMPNDDTVIVTAKMEDGSTISYEIWFDTMTPFTFIK